MSTTVHRTAANQVFTRFNQALGPLADAVATRLSTLVRRFGLAPLEVDVLLCLLAAEYDPAIGRRDWVELGTLAQLLEISTAPLGSPMLDLVRALEPAAVLCATALVQTDDPHGTNVPAVFRRYKIATRIAQHLLGEARIPSWIAVAKPSGDLLSRSLVPAAIRQATVARLERARANGEPVLLEIVGLPGTGRRALAQGLAQALGAPLVVADLGAADEGVKWTADEVAIARREAVLHDACLAVVKPSGERRLPIEPLVTAWGERGAHGNVVFVISEDADPRLATVAPALIRVEVPFPSPAQRARLLDEAVARLGAKLENAADANGVTRRYALAPEAIELAARTARDRALERVANPASPVILRATDLHEAFRHQQRDKVTSPAHRVADVHKWTDLVIPVDVYHSLRELIAYVRHADRVYDEWGFGARHSLSRGLSALFAGPPGTGKTMCASVIADELDMELFRVELSRVTDAMLGPIFDEAERSRAIILFDEADAVFAKGTRADNETHFLLQRMEAFRGITILTTNFEEAIEPAFLRRLTFRMRFERPDAEARAALWKKIFPEGAGRSADLDYDRLGAMYELTGGNIRNAAVRAAFLAAAEGRAIDMTICMLAAEREAGEMGVLVSEPPPEPLPLPEDQGEAASDVAAPVAARGRIVPVTRPRRPSE